MSQRPSISLGTVAHGSARGIPATLTALALAAVLTACGGGGGGSSGGSAVVAVTIQTQPTEQTVVANGVARFTVQATGDGLTIQWQRSTDAGASWSDISGATSAALDLSNVATTQDGYQFRAKVSGTSGAITSSAVVLHVSSVAVAPSFTVDLSSPASITAGGNVSLNVTAAGTSLTYQWQSSTNGGTTWTNVSGGNAATLALQAVPLTANGTLYRVQISNSAGTATSQTATLTVTAASAIPAITTQPQAVSVTAPNPATFTVAGGGNPSPTVQWQLSTDGGANYTDISGATAATYSTGATSLSQNNYRYRAVLTNSAGAVTSSAVALSVQAATVAPTITTAPANATVTAGATATFTVAASGTPTPTIQWQVSTDSGGTWSNITGATAASYTTAALTTADTGKRYRVVVTNGAGSATSTTATLTVSTAVSGGQTIAAGPYFSLVVAANGRVIRYGSVSTTDDISGNVISGSSAVSIPGITVTPVFVKAGVASGDSYYGGQVVSAAGSVEGWGTKKYTGWGSSYPLTFGPLILNTVHAVNYGGAVKQLGPVSTSIATALLNTGVVTIAKGVTTTIFTNGGSVNFQPAVVTGLTNVVRLNDGDPVGSTWSTFYAIKNDGTVAEIKLTVPILAGTVAASVTSKAGLTNIKSISCNGATLIQQEWHCLALKNDGTVVAWGNNNSGQFGNNTTAAINNVDPVATINLTNVVQVSAGPQRSFALTADGSVWTWGGRIPIFYPDAPITPTKLTTLSNINEISCSVTHCLFRATDGSVLGIGLSPTLLGDPTATGGDWFSTPVKAVGISLN